LIATATGIVVTRVATEGNLGSDVTGQLLQYPKLLCVAAGTIFLLGLTPINFLLTTVIALLLALGGYYLQREAQTTDQPDVEEQEKAETSAMQSPENVVNLLSMDPIRSEERRVGKEWRHRGSQGDSKMIETEGSR